MDVMERAGVLKPMLVNFALSKRFSRELSTLLDRSLPDGWVDDEGSATMVIDYFVLQHRLMGGDTVIDHFLLAHPELSSADRDLLLGWKDVVEGIFRVGRRDGDALILFNLVDELTYRTRSNMGISAFRTLKKDMFLIGRLVPLGADWMLSGNPAAFRSRDRDLMLRQAAELAMRSPEAVFRNPAKLAEARRMLAEHREVFVRLHGADLIVVAGCELHERVDEFWRALAANADAEPPAGADLDLPDEVMDAETVAIHFDGETGLSFYVDFGLLEEAFADPSLIIRRRYRETLTGYLHDDEISPTPIRLLAERDPAKSTVVFRKLLKKRGFTWEEHGESLLRKYKARYFETAPLPRNVPLSEELAKHLRRAETGTPNLGAR